VSRFGRNDEFLGLGKKATATAKATAKARCGGFFAQNDFGLADDGKNKQVQLRLRDGGQARTEPKMQAMHSDGWEISEVEKRISPLRYSR
jgi:hypothetical protein